MQIDRNEKEVADAVDAATVLPDRRSACISTLEITLPFLSLSVQIFTSPTGKGVT